MTSKQLQQKIMELQDQLQSERRLVSFDSYDMTVRQIIDMYTDGSIYIPTEYQRQFVWESDRESKLIESILLGIPIPSLFMATNPDSTWEVVDGVQRIGTIAHYIGEQALLTLVNRSNRLVIADLEKLPALNDLSYSQLPKTLQLNFLTRPIRVTVLNDKSDTDVRFDLFERLNTGGIILTPQEIRNCIYRGKFSNSIKELSTNTDFLAAVHVKPLDERNGTKEELVLRFFAFLDRYLEFDHSVKGFLNSYMADKRNKPIAPSHQDLFEKTFSLLRTALPNGIIRGNRRITPVNLFEAITVGAALALKIRPDVASTVLHDTLNSPALRKLTTGATNSKTMVTSRIEFVRDALLN